MKTTRRMTAVVLAMAALVLGSGTVLATGIVYDDFSGSSLDTAKWTKTGSGSVSVSGGLVTLTRSAGDVTITSTSTFSYGHYEFKLGTLCTSGRYIFGLFNGTYRVMVYIPLGGPGLNALFGASDSSGLATQNLGSHNPFATGDLIEFVWGPSSVQLLRNGTQVASIDKSPSVPLPMLIQEATYSSSSSYDCVSGYSQATWDNESGDGKWETAANWAPDGALDDSLAAMVGNGGTANVTSAGQKAYSLTINNSTVNIQAAGALAISKNADVASGGLLIVSGTGVLSAETVTIEQGGRLTGTGTVHAPVTVCDGGIVAPGNSPGLETFDSLTMDSNSIYEWEANGWGTAGTDYDKIVVTGLFTTEPGWKLQLQDNVPLGTTISSSDAFDVLSFGSVPTSSFLPTLDWSKVLGNSRWNAQHVTFSYVGNDIYMTGLSVTSGLGGPVPEPAALGLIGLALLAVRRRRR